MDENQWHQVTMSKIVENATQLRTIIQERHTNKKIVLVKGVYDLLHSGHYYSFVNARAYGDVLVVGVSSDRSVKERKNETRPIIRQEERLLMVAALGCVDWVTLYDDVSPYKLLQALKPDVFAASHFASLSPEEYSELESVVTFQHVPKLGGNSTSIIINTIQKETSHA